MTRSSRIAAPAPGLVATLLAVTTLLAWAPAVSAQAPASPQAPVTPEDLMARSVRPPDVRSAYGSDPLQFGELYLPEGNGPHPVLAFIHGGCFLSQFDLAHIAPLAEAVADAGYAVWSLEYRRVGDDGGGWPGTFVDVGLGLDHLRSLATEHALDMDRVVVGGHSAGGTLALWAAQRDRVPESSEIFVDEPLEVDAVVGLAAVGDLEAVQMLGVCGGVVDRLMGGGPTDVPERYAAASPMGLVPIEEPVTFVVGATDPWTPPAMSWLYRARAVGSEDIDLIELPESGHFEMIAPWSSSWPAVLEALEASFHRRPPA
ncbi:MAG: alpha/beta hydrolase [Longimicrobiales bacterium]|nr:alpha/beta hydrolase [Longimicrobiales bacterium]